MNKPVFDSAELTPNTAADYQLMARMAGDLEARLAAWEEKGVPAEQIIPAAALLKAVQDFKNRMNDNAEQLAAGTLVPYPYETLRTNLAGALGNYVEKVKTMTLHEEVQTLLADMEADLANAPRAEGVELAVEDLALDRPFEFQAPQRSLRGGIGDMLGFLRRPKKAVAERVEPVMEEAPQPEQTAAPEDTGPHAGPSRIKNTVPALISTLIQTPNPYLYIYDEILDGIGDARVISAALEKAGHPDHEALGATLADEYANATKINVPTLSNNAAKAQQEADGLTAGLQAGLAPLVDVYASMILALEEDVLANKAGREALKDDLKPVSQAISSLRNRVLELTGIENNPRYPGLKGDVAFHVDGMAYLKNYLVDESLAEAALDKQDRDTSFVANPYGLNEAWEKLNLEPQEVARLAQIFRTFMKQPDAALREDLAIATHDSLIAAANGIDEDLPLAEQKAVAAFEIGEDFTDYLRTAKDNLTLGRLLELGHQVYENPNLMPVSEQGLPVKKTEAEAAPADLRVEPSLGDTTTPLDTMAGDRIEPVLGEEPIAPLALEAPVEAEIPAEAETLAEDDGAAQAADNEYVPVPEAEAPKNLKQARELLAASLDDFADAANAMINGQLPETEVSADFLKKVEMAQQIANNLEREWPQPKDLGRFEQERMLFGKGIAQLEPISELARGGLQQARGAERHVWANVINAYDQLQDDLDTFYLHHGRESEVFATKREALREGLVNVLQQDKRNPITTEDANTVVDLINDEINASVAAVAITDGLEKAANPAEKHAVKARKELLAQANKLHYHTFVTGNEGKADKARDAMLSVCGKLAAIGIASQEAVKKAGLFNMPANLLGMPKVLRDMWAERQARKNARPQPLNLDGIEPVGLPLGGSPHDDVPEASEAMPLPAMDAQDALGPLPVKGDKIRKPVAALVFGKNALAVGKNIAQMLARKGVIIGISGGLGYGARAAVGLVAGSAATGAVVLGAPVALISTLAIATVALGAAGSFVVGQRIGAFNSRLHSVFDEKSANGASAAYATGAALAQTWAELRSGDLSKQRIEAMAALRPLLHQGKANLQARRAEQELSGLRRAGQILWTPAAILQEASRVDPVKFRMGLSSMLGGIGGALGFVLGHLDIVDGLTQHPLAAHDAPAGAGAGAETTTPTQPTAGEQVSNAAAKGNRQAVGPVTDLNAGPQTGAGTTVVDPNATQARGGTGTTVVDPNASQARVGTGTTVVDPNTAPQARTGTGTGTTVVDPNATPQARTGTGTGSTVVDPNAAAPAPAASEAIAAATTDAGKVRALMQSAEMKAAIANLSSAQQRHFATLLTNATTRGSFTALNDAIDNISEGGRMNGNTFTRIPGLRPDRAHAIELRKLVQAQLGGVEFQGRGFARALSLNEDHLNNLEGRPSRVGAWVEQNVRARADAVRAPAPAADAVPPNPAVNNGADPIGDKIIELERSPVTNVVVDAPAETSTAPVTENRGSFLGRAWRDIKGIFDGPSQPNPNDGLTGVRIPRDTPIETTALPPAHDAWTSDFSNTLRGRFSSMNNEQFENFLTGIERRDPASMNGLKTWSRSLLEDRTITLSTHERELLRQGYTRAMLATSTAPRNTI